MSPLGGGLTDLYREVILDHSRRPRNRKTLEGANRQADGFNPLCGDRLRLFLRLDEDESVREASFVGDGCAISTASASILTEALRGRTRDEALDLVRRFRAMVSGETAPGDPALGKLAVFAGVRDYPARVKCATLAWHTLRSALLETGETAVTE